MSTSPAQPPDFVGFPKDSENSDREALSAGRSFIKNELSVMSESDRWPESDPRILDLVAIHSVDIPATPAAAATAIEGEPAVRMPHASKLSVERPVVAGLPRVTDEEIDLSNGAFLDTYTRADAPTARRSRRSFSGAKAFLIICMIGIPIALILAFTSARPNSGLASIWAAWTIDVDEPAPLLQQTALSPPDEPPPASATTAGNSEFRLLPFQPESPRSAEAEESSPPKSKAVTTSMALPSDTRPATAPEAQASPALTEADGALASDVSEPEVRNPTMEPTAAADATPNAVAAPPAASPPAPAVEETSIDRKTTAVASAPTANLRPGSGRRPVREAQAGVWTHCAVNLIPTGQIAVQKAMTYHACVLAGKRCAGPRRYAEIQFFDQQMLASKAPLELCDKEN